MKSAVNLQSLAAPGVANLTPYQPGKSIASLAHEQGISNAIKLASNENPLGPDPRVLDMLKQLSAEDLLRYPDGSGDALKRQLGNRLHVSAEQVTLGNGSSELLEIIARALVTAEHEVVYSQYAFALYALVTQAINAKAVVVEAKNFCHDLAAMAKAVTPATRLMFIANPNNPTGTWITHAALHALLQSLADSVVVVLDEAYFEYVSASDYPDAIALLEEWPNLVITRTFSKAYGLAGLRIGYAISHPQLAELFNRVRQPFNVNQIALRAAETALTDSAHIKKSVALNQRELIALTQGLKRLGLSCIDSVGNFISVQLPYRGAAVYEQLLKRGIIVRALDNYHMPHHIRLTVGLPEENTRLLAALREVMGLLAKQRAS